ncbi:MAG: alpha/beta fold hydrolase [Nitrospirota bacterium]|nr:alpha/beta fold hydrolase [Nitrospirota bacterium]
MRPVPSQPLTLVGLSVTVADSRSPHSGSGDARAPLCILLHGYGAPGDDLVPLATPLGASGCRFLFPAAPLTLPMPLADARAWWHIDWAARERQIRLEGGLDLSRETPPGMLEARERVTQLIHAACAHFGTTPEEVVLGGFSQGAMLACETALCGPDRLRGLVLLSPTLLCRERWQAAARKIDAARKTGATRKINAAQADAERPPLPVFVSHGRQDSTLPFPRSEELQGLLRDAGHAVEWVPFSGGHEIPAAVPGPLREFLRRL